MRSSLLLCNVLAVVLSGCTKSAPTSSTPPDPKAALISRGRTVYQSNCTACHNNDPRLVGALGPELAHASQELIEARVLRLEYPAGYTPKRTTHVMQAMPQLKDDIPALAAYLNSL